jgi:hypothetical protein
MLSKMRKPIESSDLARKLLQAGYPFSIRDGRNKLIAVHRQINANQSVNLMPPLERVYKLCLEGKSDQAAVLISEFAGLLLASENGLASEFLLEVEVRNQMPRMLSQIRRELKKNVPPEQTPEAKSA